MLKKKDHNKLITVKKKFNTKRKYLQIAIQKKKKKKESGDVEHETNKYP